MIAAITAGGRVEAALAAEMGTEVKALAPIGPDLMVDRSIAAAREAGARRIAVIGGPAIREHCAGRVDDVIAESDDGRENLRLAIESASDEPLLLLTSDLPFVTGEAVRAFLARTDGLEIALPLASEADYIAAYPQAPEHVTAVGRERIVNGCVVYFAGGVALRALEVSQRLFEARKSLWRMASLLGPVLLARFAVGRLDIGHLERHADKLLGLRARAVRDASPALCYDVDSIEDYRYALAHLARR